MKRCGELPHSFPSKKMFILHHRKLLEVYFHMQQTAHTLKLFAESYAYFGEDCSKTT